MKVSQVPITYLSSIMFDTELVISKPGLHIVRVCLLNPKKAQNVKGKCDTEALHFVTHAYVAL